MGVGRKREIEPARAWYPSGPKIGRSNISSSNTPKEDRVPNPDPSNYKIVQASEVSGYLLIKLNYPDCTNFEGNKILLFKGVTLIDLVNQKLIDPHFFQDKEYASPIARFVPTDEGWKMGIDLIHALTEKNK